MKEEKPSNTQEPWPENYLQGEPILEYMPGQMVFEELLEPEEPSNEPIIDLFIFKEALASISIDKQPDSLVTICAEPK